MNRKHKNIDPHADNVEILTVSEVPISIGDAIVVMPLSQPRTVARVKSQEAFQSLAEKDSPLRK